jgi:hypothetical protein
VKIDFSTILLVIIAVIPGLFALRSRNLVAPRSFAPQGNSAELAELVALGIATHGILILIAAIVFSILGWHSHQLVLYFFSEIDAAHLDTWCVQHISEVSVLATVYIFISFLLSHWLGFVYGIFRLQSPFTSSLLKEATWLRNFGVTGLLGERPIIYEVLNPTIENSSTKSIFIEVEMRNCLGLYSGQLSQFAIVQDDQPHKPIYLIDVWYRKDRSMTYEQVETDGLMIDLADAVTLSVRQVDLSTDEIRNDQQAEENTNQKDDLPKEKIAELAHTYWMERGCTDGNPVEDWLRAERDLSKSSVH